MSPSQVLSPSDVTKKKYDILLVDEAHRLHQYKNISYMGTFKANFEKLGLTTEADELDWILMQSKQAVLFYDSMQVVARLVLILSDLIRRWRTHLTEE